MRVAIALFLFSVSTFASAATEQASPIVFIYRNSLNPVQMDLNAKPTESVLSKTPHRTLNPKHRTARFEGVNIVQLLGLKNRDQGALVHFVGADGYISTVPASVLLKTNALLALKQDDHKLTEREGGVQIIYPTEGPNAVEARYGAKAAFWCWYVRSIIVGDLPNGPLLGHKWSSHPKGGAPFSFEPRSVFQFEKQRCPDAVRIRLTEIARSATVSVRFLSGQSRDLRTEDFDLLMSPEKTALPVSCGGPFGLVERAKVVQLKSPVLDRDLELGVVGIEERK